MSVDARLAAKGITLPEPPQPVAAYVPCVRTGSLLYISGQLPLAAGQLLATGAVPDQVPPDQAREAAAQCVLNALAIAKHELGGNLSRIARVVRVGVFVQSVDGFAGQPQVANGASELLQDLFGDAGRHARAAVGVNALPLNAAVEVELLLEVRD